MLDEISNEDAVRSFGSVQYKVVRNAVASRNAGRDIYSGVVIKRETYGTRQIAERMVAEGCAVKSSTIRLVLTEFAELIGELVAEGRAVNVGGVVRFMPVIHGTFESPDEAWDPEKHAVVVRACSGIRMRKVAKKSPTTRLAGPAIPIIRRVIDITNGEENQLSSRGDFYISGEHLKWNTSAADEGWFIVCDGHETKCLEVSKVQNQTCAKMNTGVEFPASGMEVSLIFRTRLGKKTLHQVKFKTSLLTR